MPAIAQLFAIVREGLYEGRARDWEERGTVVLAQKSLGRRFDSVSQENFFYLVFSNFLTKKSTGVTTGA